MYCPKCGSYIPEGNRFCFECGFDASDRLYEKADSEQLAKGVVGRESTSGAKSSRLPFASKGSFEQAGAISGRLTIAIAVAAAAVFAICLLMFLRPFGQGAGGSSQAYDFSVSQVDNSSFPDVTLYAQVTSPDGTVVSDIDADKLLIKEILSNGKEHVAQVKEVASVEKNDLLSVNFVMDQSGSMSEIGKMDGAKSAALEFVGELFSSDGVQAELTVFDDYVECYQPFTNKVDLLNSAINSLEPRGQTALYDALYWALQRSNLESGNRVVVAFTDGAENASNYTADDVIELSRMTGIPVYIIGIGDEVEYGALEDLALQCRGKCYDVDDADVANALGGIYDSIYQDQLSMVRIVFTSQCQDSTDAYRDVSVCYGNENNPQAEVMFDYVPVDAVDSFVTQANIGEYVLPDSDTKVYSKSELSSMSLWELYLARNEIFARHGRGFVNQDLVEHFAARAWYTERYTPEEWDALPNQLNSAELKNVETMVAIETENDSPYLSTEEADAEDPFWGVWVYASEDKNEADDYAAKLTAAGYSSKVISSADWENLKGEPWYCVTVGLWETEGDAERRVALLHDAGYSSAYSKYSGNYVA